MSDRKYRQRGYRDDDRERSPRPAPRPAPEPGAPAGARRISQDGPRNINMPILAFRDLIGNRIPEQYPKLKFGFIEASAGWVPFMMHILKRLFRPADVGGPPQ